MRRVCIYCGSSPGRDPAYREAAVALAGELARRGLGIVYGGAHVGLMGVVADTALEAGAEVIGVIPQGLVDREIAHTGLTDLRVVHSMHERKAQMAELADAFVALPGGLGTLEELTEVLSWAQLELHAKPIGLLEVDDYFGHLEAFLDHAVATGFIAERHRRLLLRDEDLDRLLERFAAWSPPEGRFPLAGPRSGPGPGSAS
jgi:uncharacterized protein (TIGR00730 family)